MKHLGEMTELEETQEFIISNKQTHIEQLESERDRLKSLLERAIDICECEYSEEEQFAFANEIRKALGPSHE